MQAEGITFFYIMLQCSISIASFHMNIFIAKYILIIKIF